MNASVTLTGIEVTASNLPLPDVSTWFAWYYQRNIDYSAGSLVSSGDIVATTYIQDVFTTGDAYSTTNSTQISTEFGSISAYADAVIVYETTQLDSQSADIFANGDATSSLITIEITSESEAFTPAGDANGLVDGTELISEYENIAPIGTANVQIDGLFLEIQPESIESTGNGNSSAIVDAVASFIETVQTQASAESQIDSIELIFSFGEVSAFADEPISAEVSINGISLQISAANVVATAISDKVIQLSGNPKRYAANEFKYAKVKIDGISTKISTGAVKAIGSVSISARANVQSVGIKSEVPTIYAEGVKWITEDELMTLLAA